MLSRDAKNSATCEPIDPQLITNTTLCLKKGPTFILSITLSNLNGFSPFCIAEKRMKCATELIRHYQPYLKRVATLPWEIKKSIFWPSVNCACVPQRFNRLLTPRFVQLLSENPSVNLFAV